MVNAWNRVVVQRPAPEVFDYLADGTNNPAWRPGVLTVTHVSGEGLGATWAQTMAGPGGRRICGDYRITRFDRPTRLDFQVVTGRARPTGSFLFEDQGGVTRVRFQLDITPTGIMRLLTRRMIKQMEREVANLDNLHSLLP